MSNGQYLTSISQDDLKIAGGFHVTFPSLWSTAFVIVVITYSPSALGKSKVKRAHQYSTPTSVRDWSGRRHDTKRGQESNWTRFQITLFFFYLGKNGLGITEIKTKCLSNAKKPKYFIQMVEITSNEQISYGLISWYCVLNLY